MSPSVSINQQNSAAIALAVRRGNISIHKLRGASRQMYKSMTTEELEKLASTKHKNLPERKGK